MKFAILLLMRKILIMIFVVVLCAFAQERSIFSEPTISSRYSPKLQEKNARSDSLLPALDGDMAFAELVRIRPGLWSLARLDEYGEVLTKLQVDLVYIDGIREDQFCILDKKAPNSQESWSLSIGIDFVSGGSNTVEVHVQQCLDYARNELGYQVRKGDKVVNIPPRKVIEEIAQSEIPEVLAVDLQARVLNAHREVAHTGQCPKDIDAYMVLFEVWEQVKDIHMDLVLINDFLNPKNNGKKAVHSCAFSREWNKRYSESAVLRCNIDANFCKYKQSEDGTTRWSFDYDENVLIFEPLKVLFLKFGGKSIRKGGAVMDLRIIQLSSSMFLEAYIDKSGLPATLGLITVGK